MSAVDWTRFRKCPVCDAAIGEPCLTLLARPLGERRHDRVALRPHSGRLPRSTTPGKDA